MTQYETRSRSIVKAISWRVCATLTTTVIVYLFTKRLDIALMVGGIEAAAKMVIYFYHERFWNRLKFGKKEIEPFVLWFTGVPYSGKTSIANEVYNFLRQRGIKAERLDSTNVRSLFPEVGFSKEEVNSHIKRVGHLAATLEKNGIVVVASFVSPYLESREFVKKICKNFIEIHTKSPLETCRERYTSSLSTADSKIFPEEIYHLYEEPKGDHVSLNTGNKDIAQCKKDVLNHIRKTTRDKGLKRIS